MLRQNQTSGQDRCRNARPLRTPQAQATLELPKTGPKKDRGRGVHIRAVRRWQSRSKLCTQRRPSVNEESEFSAHALRVRFQHQSGISSKKYGSCCSFRGACEVISVVARCHLGSLAPSAPAVRRSAAGGAPPRRLKKPSSAPSVTGMRHWTLLPKRLTKLCSV